MVQGHVTELAVARAFLTPTRRTLFTLVSKRTGTRFTYQVSPREPHELGAPSQPYEFGAAACKPNHWYADVLNGPNNEADFAALAVVTQHDSRLFYYHAGASKIGADAPSALALHWFFHEVVQEKREDQFAKCEVWHEGKCAVCGRRLSKPASIERGIGPECAGRLA